MKQLAPVIQKDLEQFGYKYFPVQKEIEDILSKKDSFIYLLKSNNVYENFYCIPCHAFSPAYDGKCFFCNKSNKINHYSKPVYSLMKKEVSTFKYESIEAEGIYSKLEILDSMVYRKNSVTNKEFILPFKMKNINISINFEKFESFYEEVINEYKMHIDLNNEKAYLYKEDKKINLIQFVKENNEGSLKSLNNLFESKLFDVQTKLNLSKIKNNRLLISMLIKTNHSVFFLEDITHYNTNLIDYENYLRLPVQIVFDESIYSKQAITNICNSYTLNKAKALNIFKLKEMMNLYPEKVNMYAEKYRTYNFIFILWYISKGIDESILDKWLNVLNTMSGNKYLFVDFISKYNLNPDTLSNYLNYLEQYEALSKSKAMQSYIKYLNNLDETVELTEANLYPKDILIKL